MKTLALRIYLTVVAVLLVFALVSGWLAQHNIEHERAQTQSITAWNERAAAWAELLENSLPTVDAPRDQQALVFLDWAERLRLPMALDDPQGRRIATSSLLADRLQRRPELLDRMQTARLSDGRTLWILRPSFVRLKGAPPGPLPEASGPGFRAPLFEVPAGMVPTPPAPPRMEPWLSPMSWIVPPWLAQGLPAFLLSLVVLFLAVAVGAWPVVNRLTARLKALRQGVQIFGAGDLAHRVAVEGRDEVAALARSFNEAAQQVQDLVTSNRSLLANASHELRSPLARLKMAISLMDELPPERLEQMKAEIHQDIRELDALVEEVLLASRLDARTELQRAPVDLMGLVTEEAQRVGAQVDIQPHPQLHAYEADERLIRRAVRNLLENARRYGGPEVLLELSRLPTGPIQIAINDRGPGVPADQRERIFEPFYRLAGHAEYAGGVGLGLSLVRQIAQRHGGRALCAAREGGGSRFVISLPG
jgi:signal transduction histidine kinase